MTRSQTFSYPFYFHNSSYDTSTLGLTVRNFRNLLFFHLLVLLFERLTIQLFSLFEFPLRVLLVMHLYIIVSQWLCKGIILILSCMDGIHQTKACLWTTTGHISTCFFCLNIINDATTSVLPSRPSMSPFLQFLPFVFGCC